MHRMHMIAVRFRRGLDGATRTLVSARNCQWIASAATAIGWRGPALQKMWRRMHCMFQFVRLLLCS